MEGYAPSSQPRAVSKRGTSFAIVHLRTLLQHLAARQQSMVCRFLDVVSAFDAVARRFVVTFAELGPSSAFAQAGLDGQDEVTL